jgi:hypothetical protein
MLNPVISGAVESPRKRNSPVALGTVLSIPVGVGVGVAVGVGVGEMSGVGVGEGASLTIRRGEITQPAMSRSSVKMAAMIMVAN